MGKIIDKNEFWFIEKNPITKVGVFPYLGKQISADCEPDKIYYVLRPKEELFKKETLDSLKLLPLVDEHTMLGKDFTAPEDKGIDGILGEQVVHDNDTIYTDIKIFSEDMKEKIRDGKKELSLGYFCSYDKQEGTYKGQRYDYIQKDIIGNHLALVDKGRMGSDVRVYDKALCFDTLEGIDTEKLEYKKTQGEDEMAEEKKELEEIKKAKDEEKEEEVKEEKKEVKDKCGKDEEKEIEIKKKEEVEDEDEDEKKDDDKKVEDEDEEEEKKKEEKKGMDEADVIKMIARKEKLAKDVEKVLGTFDHSEMTEQEVARYACDKLELEADKGSEVVAVKSYLKGIEKNKVVVSVHAEDSVNIIDTSFDNYIKNAKK